MGIQDLLMPLVIGLSSSYLTYYFTVKSKKEDSMRAFKESAYTNLIVKLQGFQEDKKTLSPRKNSMKKCISHGSIVQMRWSLQLTT